MIRDTCLGKYALCSMVVFITLLITLSCNFSQTAYPTTVPLNPSSSVSERETERARFHPSPSMPPTYNPNPAPTHGSGGRWSDGLATQTISDTLASATPVDNIDMLLSTCPTEVELERFHTDFHILFDNTIPFPAYACHNGKGPDGEVNPKLALYQGLRVIHALRFDQPLPWTEQSLYEWLKGAIHGIVITDAEYSHCCEAGKQIVLKEDLLFQPDYQVWANPQSGSGLLGLVGLIVHEARHAEIGGHTCGPDDQTLEELGAWGVQYYLFNYLAEETPPNFFNQEQRQITINHANTAFSHICNP